MKKKGVLIGSGVIAAIASSLCCIVPLLALIAGGTGAASNLSWIEPFRPYLIGFTILILGYAWYQKLKPQEDCCQPENQSFMQSKLFLFIITLFAGGMLALPNYSQVFYGSNTNDTTVYNDSSTIVLAIEGMTCTACENHIVHALGNSTGVIRSSASYENGTATITYDAELTDINNLSEIIKRETGYEVLESKK